MYDEAYPTTERHGGREVQQHSGQKSPSSNSVGRQSSAVRNDRELHGALLDSQILGDVYLSMTGGQSDLDFLSLIHI